MITYVSDMPLPNINLIIGRHRVQLLELDFASCVASAYCNARVDDISIIGVDISSQHRLITLPILPTT